VVAARARRPSADDAVGQNEEPPPVVAPTALDPHDAPLPTRVTGSGTLNRNLNGITDTPPRAEPASGRSTTTDDPDKRTPHRRRWSRRRVIGTIVSVPVVIAVVLGIGLGVTLWRMENVLDHKISRFGDPFAKIPASARPTPVAGATAAMNVLVFGSDQPISPGDPAQWAVGGQRTDAIMLVHLPADRSAAYVISIPRDAQVQIPGHGKARINSAFSIGGPSLAIQTVEQLTQVKIDHMVITDFTGFAKITDLLGGVKVTAAAGRGGSDLSTYTMDGRTALAYVRQPGGWAGELERERRQQAWIRGLLRGVSDSGIITDPQRLFAMLDAAAGSVSTDSTFSITEMRDLILSLHNTDKAGVTFVNAPVGNRQPSGSNLDLARSTSLWTALAQDKVASWVSGKPTSA
jgi:LCP family protein required for cell wall assembly